MITDRFPVLAGSPRLDVDTALPGRLSARAIGLAVAAGAALGVAYTLSPMAIWFFLGSLAILRASGYGLSERERRWVRGLLVAAILLRLVAVVLLFLFGEPDAVKTSIKVFFGDEQYGIIRALRLRNVWLGVPISQEAFADVYDTYGQTSYVTVIALVQMLVGPSPYGLHLLNTLFYLTAALVLHRIARRSYGPIPALGALLLLLFLPSMTAWSVSALKESLYFLMTVLTLAAALAVVRAPWSWRPAALAAMLACIAIIQTFRTGAIQMVAGGLGLGFLSRLATRRYWRLAVAAIAVPLALIAALRYPPIQDRVMEQLRAAARMHQGHVYTAGHSYKLLDDRLYESRSSTQSMTPDEAVRFVARAIVSFIVVPLPWDVRSRSELAFLPEQIIWYLLLVAGLVGLIAGVQRDALLTGILTCYVLVASGIVALNSGNVGTLVRHRAFVLPYLVVLSALGLTVLLGQATRALAIGADDVMAIIDERGRLFGRINLIDLSVLVIAVVMIPLAYGAYLLFRTPPTRVTAVAPASIPLQKGEMRVKVTGEHFRPFLKASIGELGARAFLVETSERAEVTFVDIPAGTYDLVLYNEAEEVARLKNGLTITPPPPPPPPPAVTLQALGAFVGPPGSTSDLASGRALGSGERPVAQILELGDTEPDFKRLQVSGTLLLAPVAKSERRNATLRIGCEMTGDTCMVAAVPLANGLVLSLPDGRGTRSFVVDEVRGDSVLVSDITVRFTGLPEVVGILKAGDVDRPAGAGPMRGAVITSLEETRNTTGTINMNSGINAADVSVFIGSQLNQSLAARDARVRVPIEAAPVGWKYRGALMKPGAVLTFETPTYSIRALILRMTPPTIPVGSRAPRADQ